MLSRRGFLSAAAAASVAGGLAACAKKSGSSATSGTSGGAAKLIKLGFAQTGAESGWRTANTKSIQDSCTAANGIDLKFVDCQGKPENQIAAVRNFIQQKVDIISFSPIVTTGWDAILAEVKAANIPVVLTDRSVDVADQSLWVTLVGSDFEAEGERAGHMMEKVLTGMTTVNLAQLEGTTGSAPQIERTKGFKKIMDTHPEWKLVVSQTGNFERAKGKEVMAAFLQSHPEINALFAQNDDMGLGAIQAIEAAGKKPGTDIKIVTIDAIKDGFTAMAAGKINGLCECNPILGPQLVDTVKKVINKESVDKWIKTKEQDFTQDQAAAALPSRQY
jgi:galactofuranose transport system substrate-binding protein